MTEEFNPYYKWLGIPLKDQPANHYRLLGIETFESDVEVIENAADQRMAYVRMFAAGQHGQLSQKLLNEIAAARVCLLDDKHRTVYDEKLRQQIQSAKDAPAEDSPTEDSQPNQDSAEEKGSQNTEMVGTDSKPFSLEVCYPDALPAMAAIGLPEQERLNPPAKKRWR